jgi:hypothetical protein
MAVRPPGRGCPSGEFRTRCHALRGGNRADGEELTFQKMSTYANHLGLYSNLDYQLGYGAGNVAAAGFRSLVSNMLEHLRSGA